MKEFDAEKFINDYRANVSVKHGSKKVFIVPPWFHYYSDESIAIGVSLLPDGRPVFSDCGTTCDYLSANYINLSDHRERLQKILKEFSLVQDGQEFRMELASDSPNYMMTALGWFLEALSLIAYIDI